MKLRRLSLLGLLAVLCSLALVPASSGAFVVGVGEENPSFFSEPNLVQLNPVRTRYITPYDSIFKDPDGLDAWMSAAHATGMEVVVAFNPPAGMKCPNLHGARGCKPVSGSRYKAAFRAFRKHYPWVRIFQPWNEVNNVTQPTALHPDAVVAYYKIARGLCRGCTILGADIQDVPNMVAYTKTLLKLFRKAHVATPRLWGMHNYSDVNRFIPDRNSNMRKAVKLLPGKIWLTETGGLYRFQPQNSRQTFRPDLTRQKRAMQALFNEANHYRGKIARVYLYQWFASTPDNRWDSGILDATGQPRPVYSVLQRYRSLFR